MGDLQIRIGRAGTGKSETIAREIAALIERDPLGAPVYWIVPDDVAYTAEQMLLKHATSTLRAEVITLRRLADRIWLAAGQRKVTQINATGKRLLLASVYADVAAHLGPLRREQPSTAYYDIILQAFDDMSEQLVDLDQLEGAIEVAATAVQKQSGMKKWQAGHSLLGKLRDLCILYIRYRRALDARAFVDGSRWLTLVHGVMSKCPSLSNATVYLDGFADMTPQIQEFVLGLIQCAGQATLTLSIDGAWLQDDGFQMWQKRQRVVASRMSPEVRSTRLLELMGSIQDAGAVYAPKTLLLYADTIAMCEREGISYQVCMQDDRNRKTRDLVDLERTLFSDDAIPHAYQPERVQIVAAQHARSEMDGIAQEIKRNVVNGGVSYQDIAVIVSNMDQYAGYIRDIFTRYDIPYSLDEFPSLASYSLAKFLLAALHIVEEDFSTESLLRLLKTEFSGLSDDDADWLETYILTHEIKTSAIWLSTEPWTYGAASSDGYRTAKLAEDDVRAERLRQRVLTYFAPFYDTVRLSENTPRNIAIAIWNLFMAVNAKQQVATWMVNEDGRQNPLAASLHEQAWQMLIALCNDLTNVAPDSRLARADMLHILTNDIEHQSLSTIPMGINQVLVTDISRAHAWTADIVFVAGLTDKVLPRRFRANGILQDGERIAFHKLFGQTLGFTSVEEQIADCMTTYEVMTRARRSLTLTYPLSSVEGKEVRPSSVLKRIESLFAPGSWAHMHWYGGEALTSSGNGSEHAQLVLTVDAALDLLAEHVQAELNGTHSTVIVPIVDWFMANKVRQVKMYQALRGFVHQHSTKHLSAELTRELYGQPFKANVYQLESFAACPYKHFAQFGLRVSATEQMAVTPAIRGTFVHDVLQAFVKEQMDNLAVWRQMTDAEAMVAVDVHFSTALHAPKAAIWRREGLRLEQAHALQSVLHQAAIMLTRHARYGLFSPHAVELAFGGAEATSLPSFEVDLAEGVIVSLRGRIDRVDVLLDGEEAQFRIIDYKSSQLDIDLTKVEHGLRLQLPVYAAAIEYHSPELFGKPAKASGILYMPIVQKVDLKNVPSDEQVAHVDALKKMRARGWMIADKSVIGAMDERLLDGTDTELFAKVYTKSGTLTKSAPALDPDEWRMLMARAMANVRSFARRILSGEIQLAPYRFGQGEKACTFCDYQALCHLDVNQDGALFRRLDKLRRSDIRNSWSPFVSPKVSNEVSTNLQPVRGEE